MRCTICAHLRRAQLELGMILGTSMRELAKRFECSSDALQRHSKRHLTPTQRAPMSIWRLYNVARAYSRSLSRSGRGCKATLNKPVSLAIHGSPSWLRPASPRTLSLSPSCSAN